MRRVMLSLALAVCACGGFCTPGETTCVGGFVDACVLDHMDTSCYGDGEYQTCSTTPTGHWETTSTPCGQQRPSTQPTVNG